MIRGTIPLWGKIVTSRKFLQGVVNKHTNWHPGSEFETKASLPDNPASQS